VVELGASCVLGKSSTAGLHSQPVYVGFFKVTLKLFFKVIVPFYIPTSTSQDV
jgi:hypothetical protein